MHFFSSDSRSALQRLCLVAAAVIMACGGESAVTSNVVTDTQITRITISPSAATLSQGDSLNLMATAFNAAGQTITPTTFAWSSNAPSVASVSATGRVAAIAPGTTSINASAGGVAGTATIVVNALGADSVVASVVVSPSLATVQLGTTITLGAVARNAAGQTLGGRTFTWTSSTPALASVNAAGIVTGVAVGGPVTVTASSGGKTGAAAVRVVALPTSTGTITVNGSQQFQTMKGWEALGGMGHGECDPRAEVTYIPEVINRAANEVGINRVKFSLRPGYEHTTDWFQQFESGLITFQEWNAVAFTPQNDNNDPFVINPAGFQWSHIDYAVETLVLPLKQQLQARGDDLWFSVQPNGARTAGLYQNSPDEYAEFVLAAFQHLQQKYGLVPNSLEVMNEPNLAGWNPPPVGLLAAAAKQRLNQAGFFPDIIAPSASGIQSTIIFFDQIITLPGVAQAVTDISYHRYGGGASVSQMQAVAQRATQYGMSTAMTEHGGSGYLALHDDLTIANVSAWEQFGLAFCSTTDNAGKYFGISGALIGQNNPVVITLGQTKYLRQYFRYVGLKAVRVGAQTTDSNFAPVAFRNANGKYVVVVKAAAGGTFTVGGLPAGTYGIDFTTATDYMRPLADVTITSAQALSASIPTTGVLTVFAR